MGKTKKYWKGIEELKESPDFLASREKEFNDYVPVNEFMADEQKLENSSASRRDFLKFLGFSVTAASLAACETPVTKAIPYLNKPEEVNPGVANYYASTYYDGTDFSSVLVKTREGRPIFVEANKSSKLSSGGINARINSSVLSLYDSNRYQHPMANGEKASWEAVDTEIGKQLNDIRAKGGAIRILTNTIISPSTNKLIREFQSSDNLLIEQEDGSLMPSSFSAKHITYDSISYQGILEANKEAFGKRAIPSYHFDKAKTIVSVGADFAANWLDSVNYAVQYAAGRNPEGSWMSRHYQFETVMSLSGTNADVRVPIKPSEHAAVVKALYNAVAAKMGQTKVSGNEMPYQPKIDAAAADLISAKGFSIVVSGSNDKNVQLLVNAINNMLGNYGSTIDINNSINLFKGDDAQVAELIKEMKSGAVDALIVSGVDPMFTLPADAGFQEAFEKVGLTISLASYPDQTSQASKYVCPDSHYLESWNDAEPTKGQYALVQPTISPLYDTRQMQESILRWTGSDASFHDYMKAAWEKYVLPKTGTSQFFEEFWNNCLHDGVCHTTDSTEEMALQFNIEDISAVASGIAMSNGGALELELYQKIGIGDGKHANNPWLQELPDPITKITWDNYITMSPTDMEERMYNTLLGQEQRANRVVLTVNGISTDPIPVIAQPGQPKGTIGLAVGYGKEVWKLKEKIGVNAFPLASMANGAVSYFAYDVSIADVEGSYEIAATQTQHTIMGRDSIIKETDLGTFLTADKEVYNPKVELITHDGMTPISEIDLWESHPVEDIGHRWGMAIDLNTCIGCGACVTACHSENNVPVVGKDEIRRGRDMHWLRIDRYYSSDEDYVEESERSYTKMEVPEEANPKVVHQPMMCQHCNHAPCETVCPVAATTHSNEGLNQMTYNRCIGTRYCANNCPYKVRRFNWFNYIGNSKFEGVNPSQDDLGRMVLNPDVVVRSRGVMEKCSMCVQRIQAGKLEAKKSGEPVKDGAIQTACAAACPSGSITFGDLNDTDSKVREKSTGKRAYKVLEEVGTQSNISYLTKVRNIETNLA